MNVKNQQGYDDGKHAVTKGFKSRFVHRRSIQKFITSNMRTIEAG